MSSKGRAREGLLLWFFGGLTLTFARMGAKQRLLLDVTILNSRLTPLLAFALFPEKFKRK
jgi:hypothetical protein